METSKHITEEIANVHDATHLSENATLPKNRTIRTITHEIITYHMTHRQAPCTRLLRLHAEHYMGVKRSVSDLVKPT